MANLKDCSKYTIDNNYYTRKDMWENIQHLIPKDKVIWEMCLLNSKSKSMDYLRELGFNVVGNTEWDCLETTPDNFDMIVTNPPFETKIKKKILERLVTLDKPFIIILNIMNVCTGYMREIFGDKLKDLQIIIPRNKIRFEKYDEVNKKMVRCNDPAFYSGYLAYKLNLDTKDLWLRNDDLC